jgi:hypothetical protein
MRHWVVLVLFLFALGTLRVVACGEEGRLCVDDEDCDDGNPCTSDWCWSYDPDAPITCEVMKRCRYSWSDDGTPCKVGDRDGVCVDGQCVEDPCEGVVCDDRLACTDDTCDDTNGKCVFTNLCDDGDPCTKDTCNPDDGICDFTALADGANCLGDDEYVGICEAGICVDLPTDACTNAEDLTIVCDPGFMDEVEMCAVEAFPHAVVTPLCLIDRTAVSAQCASCYGATVHCIFVNCFEACASGAGSQGCEDCQTDFGCDIVLDECTGDLASACDVGAFEVQP